MPSELLIRYQRDIVEGGDSSYSGEFLDRQDDGSAPVLGLKDFTKATFKSILIWASQYLTSKEYARVILERTDRQGLAPVVLDNPTVEMLRSDPAKAIRMMNYESNNAFSDRVRRTPPPPMLAGYDTISETLGYWVYCRVRYTGARSMVECPGCGRWIPATVDIRCPETAGCPIVIRASYVEDWAKVRTQHLLGLDLPRYFLPRGFNPNRPWMTKAALQALYDQWLLVKEQNKENKS